MKIVATIIVGLALVVSCGSPAAGSQKAHAACREWQVYQTSFGHDSRLTSSGVYVNDAPSDAGQTGLSDAQIDAAFAAQASPKYTALSQDLNGVQVGLDTAASQAVDDDCANVG